MKKIIIKIIGLLTIFIGLNIPINPLPFAIGACLITQIGEKAAYVEADKVLLIIAALITLNIIGSYFSIGGVITGLITGFTITVTLRGLLQIHKMSTRRN